MKKYSGLYNVIKSNFNVDIDQVISAYEMIMLEEGVWTTNKVETLSLLVVLMEQKGADNGTVAADKVKQFLKCIYTQGTLDNLLINTWDEQSKNICIADVLIELIEVESDFTLKRKEKEFYQYLLSQGNLTFLKMYLYMKVGILDFLELRELLINKESD